MKPAGRQRPAVALINARLRRVSAGHLGDPRYAGMLVYITPLRWHAVWGLIQVEVQDEPEAAYADKDRHGATLSES
ncbi:hypothetical protein U5801_25595 [Lamprobacter modestohalophilus]|uniref:hypothetical protein n=1 Tax=Lamprobacter modestohalophilus TaxID=1064514 RepID=UPI002ADEB2DF|nr:hypothetical protein [Lamprobacter modestohalophilus]MEA1053155.1 hypothetical protein [Lamprobacter modestohalophilus]